MEYLKPWSVWSHIEKCVDTYVHESLDHGRAIYHSVALPGTDRRGGGDTDAQSGPSLSLAWGVRRYEGYYFPKVPAQAVFYRRCLRTMDVEDTNVHGLRKGTEWLSELENKEFVPEDFGGMKGVWVYDRPEG